MSEATTHIMSTIDKLIKLIDRQQDTINSLSRTNARQQEEINKLTKTVNRLVRESDAQKGEVLESCTLTPQQQRDKEYRENYFG